MMVLRHCPHCGQRTAHQIQTWWYHLDQRFDWPDNAGGDQTTCTKCGAHNYHVIAEYDDNDQPLRDIEINLQPHSVRPT